MPVHLKQETKLHEWDFCKGKAYSKKRLIKESNRGRKNSKHQPTLEL